MKNKCAVAQKGWQLSLGWELPLIERKPRNTMCMGRGNVFGKNDQIHVKALPGPGNLGGVHGK